MHDDGYDQRPEPPRTIEECGKCHAPAEPGTQSVVSAGPSGVVTVFHTRECLDEFRREMSARADEGAQRDAVMRRGMAALRAYLRDHPPAPADDAAPYAAVLAELVEQYLVADMRGRYVVHRDVFEVAGRHLAHVPGIDGTPAPSPDGAPEGLEPYTVPEDDTALLAWVLDHGGTIPYDGDLQFRPDPLHRIVLPDGVSIVVAPGDRLLGGNGTIHLAVPDGI
jgi:hypothetical protein